MSDVEDNKPTTLERPPTPSEKLSRAFWMLCTMEMWERLAYYGVRVVLPIYIMQADEPGGLHFTAEQKGSIYAWWFVFQSILPTFTGGFADRYGFKNTLAFSVTLKLLGYVLMATQRSYEGFFLGAMVLATGTAQFKPGIQGALAHELPKEKSSTGWGIFYWLVNVGAMMGPPLAGYLHAISWPAVFYSCAGIVSLNYLMLFTFKEPDHQRKDERGFVEVFQVTLVNFFEPRLLAFLGIMSGFWLMMYQLWDLHPNFVTDWVNSGGIANALPRPEAWTETRPRGLLVKQENLLNLNAALIVLFVIPVSAAVKKLKTLQSMLGGMVIATMGIVVSGVTTSGWVFLLGVVFFSAGEMLTGPKKNEYLGLIAPPDKRGQYLGYVNIPVGVGGFIGSYMAGHLYGTLAEKATLALRYLAEHTEYLAQHGRPAWNGDIDSLEAATGVPRSEAYATLMDVLHQDGATVTQLLWDTYDPWQIWFYFAAIGVMSTVALIFYNRAARNWKDMNV